MLRVLVIFSDPPSADRKRLRLDIEDRTITDIAKRFSASVALEKQQASRIDDIHALLIDTSYDVIQFSGHGDSRGLYLEKSDLESDGDLVSVKRLQSLMSIPENPPRLVVFLSCYSNDHLIQLSHTAPFVISAVGNVSDACCVEFVGAFYERLFTGFSIKNSFQHSLHVMKAKGIPCESFRLDRRVLLHKNDRQLVETFPDPHRDSIWVDLSQVSHLLDRMGYPEEEILHLISKKLSIHRWIFEVPRERCIVPIGRLLFGEFAWEDPHDLVRCTRIMKLKADVSAKHWEVWHKLLVAYNDLASSEYRAAPNPAGEESRTTLQRAVNLFAHYNQRYILPAREDVAALGFTDCLPYIEFVITHCEQAQDQFAMERYPQVVKALEEALTNFHELVDGLLPPEAAISD